MKQIPAFKLVPEPTTQEARDLPKFRWAGPLIGTRHQIGGAPELVEETDWPWCPNGHGKLTAYLKMRHYHVM